MIIYYNYKKKKHCISFVHCEVTVLARATLAYYIFYSVYNTYVYYYFFLYIISNMRLIIKSARRTPANFLFNDPEQIAL